MSHLSAWIGRAGPLFRALIAFAAGAAGALALAPVNFMPAMAVSMTLAVWMIDAAGGVKEVGPTPRGWRVWRRLPAPARRAFWVGWLWGFGYFVAGLWWLGAAFLVEAEQFAWAMPLGVVGLPAALALYPALGFFIARVLWTRGAARIFIFAGAMTFAEWLRGHLFTGFPWNAYGMALAGDLRMAQAASIFGLYGLTLLALLIFAAPATLSTRPLTARALRPLGATVLTLGALLAFGAARLAEAPSIFVPDLQIKIMQPNIAQDDKFRPEYRREIVGRYLALSDLSAADPDERTLLVWPESAFPFILSRDPESLEKIGTALAPGSFLATGAARVERAPAGSPRGERPLFFNAIQIISSAGFVVASYDKSHLVPFGEYLPFESLFAAIGLRQFVAIPGGFEPGPGRRTLQAPGLPPMAPLICYEAIFPGEALPQEPGAPRPAMMLNVTDDGWFGRTAGPYQHLSQARLRAVEEGLPLVRAANTGISAIVDPYGRILAELPLATEGLLASRLPQALAPTPFARFGGALALAAWLAVAGCGIAAFLRKSI